MEIPQEPQKPHKMTRKDAILLVGNGISQETIGKFHSIRRATESFADSFLLVDSSHADKVDNILMLTAPVEIIYFDWDGLKSMGYTPLFDDSKSHEARAMPSESMKRSVSGMYT